MHNTEFIKQIRAIRGIIIRKLVSDLVGVVVADDALVLREAQLAALICGQSKSGQEARSQSMDWGVVIGNCRDKAVMLTTLQIVNSPPPLFFPHHSFQICSLIIHSAECNGKGDLIIQMKISF